MQVKEVTIQTLWRTAFEQCELVFLGLLGCRLGFEEVFDWTHALRRASELRVEWPGLVG